MLVDEYYRDCLDYQESSLAYCIYQLLLEEKIIPEDDASKIDLSQVDLQKVAELIQANVLKIQKIGVYSLKMDEKTFIFIFAGSHEEARQFYTQTFGQAPLNCHEYPLDFQLIRGNIVVTFRELKKELENFPAIAGHYVKP